MDLAVGGPTLANDWSWHPRKATAVSWDQGDSVNLSTCVEVHQTPWREIHIDPNWWVASEGLYHFLKDVAMGWRSKPTITNRPKKVTISLTNTKNHGPCSRRSNDREVGRRGSSSHHAGNNKFSSVEDRIQRPTSKGWGNTNRVTRDESRLCFGVLLGWGPLSQILLSFVKFIIKSLNFKEQSASSASQ